MYIIFSKEPISSLRDYVLEFFGSEFKLARLLLMIRNSIIHYTARPTVDH